MKTRVALMTVLAVILVAVMTSFATAADTVTKATTIDNLKAAFTGETTASAKYAAYGKKAKEEGFLRIATLFEAASKSESIHAGNHKAVLEQLGDKAPEVTPKYEVKTTADNLQDAINGESYEVATMYPEFLKNATDARVNIALISFNYAYQTEQNHKIMYTKALESLKKGAQDSLPSKYLVCSTCGNTYDASAPNRCVVCMTSKDRFIAIG
jgi:rubrerythrin